MGFGFRVSGFGVRVLVRSGVDDSTLVAEALREVIELRFDMVVLRPCSRGEGSGSRVWDLGVGIWGLGLGVWDLECGIGARNLHELGWHLGLRVEGFWFRISSLGFRVEG